MELLPEEDGGDGGFVGGDEKGDDGAVGGDDDAFVGVAGDGLGDGIELDLVVKLAGAFGTTPQFWLNLQANYDLAVNRPNRAIRPLTQAA